MKEQRLMYAYQAPAMCETTEKKPPISLMQPALPGSFDPCAPQLNQVKA
jgi:hypothetical protein